jgi:MYXO-CTERM domain-containing protein
MQRLVALVAILTLGTASAAKADGFMSWNVCGGNTFMTCAAVQVNVVGTNVTMRVWNNAGLNGSYGGTVFTGVGLFNVPAGVNAVLNTVTTCNKHGTCSTNTVPTAVTAMSGPTRGSDNPSAWQIRNDTQIGGGVRLDLVGSTFNGIGDGIASNCLTSALPGGTNQLWMNPTCGTGGVTNPTTNGGWVEFSFAVTQTWDPSQGTELLVKGQNGPNGQSTECITSGQQLNCYPFTPPPPPPPPPQVAPEPISMTLLGTGLLGIGGAGLRRRRKKATDVESAE